ncbi:MAG TPA: methylamine utilization protein [Rhizobacter sp.]|nr:methylamine utilization protein [Rhizobacter sp.]
MRFRTFFPMLPGCAVLVLGFGAQAASLSVSVTDLAGHPVPDAVVMLEPASGKLPVKPLPVVEVGQMQRQFNPRVTVITVGTPVGFPNYDTVRHHVYSFSPIKPFELKLYAGVPSAPLVFDKPGIAVLGCNIHDQMAAWIVVVDTPHYARTSAEGQARLDNISAGAYKLRAWYAGMGHGEDPVSQALTVAAGDMTANMKLPDAAP